MENVAKVLIVDDDAPLVRLLSLIFRQDGFEVATAGNGLEALSQVDVTAPDVIILDLEMPVMDGRTFFRELRSRGIETPVLILSALDARSARRELAAEASMAKPFDPDELVSNVGALAGAH